MFRYTPLILSLFLVGCGVDVATTAAVGGATKAEELKQAEKTKERFQEQLGAALQQGQQRLESADAAAGQ